MAGWLGVLTDLVLPTVCAGCGAPGSPQVCDVCLATLASARPASATPTPAPAGLPPCVAVGPYADPLRELLLAYKERGAYRLARPLGAALASAVATAAQSSGVRVGTPLVIVPVPGTAASIRERHGDHMVRLAGYAARALTGSGWPAAVARPLHARPKADSSHLSAVERAAAAGSAFRARSAPVRRIVAAAHAGAAVVVVDDILTTGSTMAAVARVLEVAGVPVIAGATLAATRLRFVRV